jgi:hypothetical protein
MKQTDKTDYEYLLSIVKQVTDTTILKPGQLLVLLLFFEAFLKMYKRINCVSERTIGRKLGLPTLSDRIFKPGRNVFKPGQLRIQTRTHRIQTWTGCPCLVNKNNDLQELKGIKRTSLKGIKGLR